MLLRRVAIALLASGVVVTTMGITSAATGDVAQSPRQLTPGGELHGSGASFPCGYIEQAIEDADNDDLVVTYDCNGSGTGRAEFIEGTVDFAGTDVPLSDAEEAQLAAKGTGYLQFAYVGGGIVIAYNPGSGLPYNLRLSADTIGKIFSGRIVNWDDPELADENPGVSLPDLSLRVAARSDSSGTTNGFTSFLAQTSTSWTAGARDVFDSPPLPAFPGLVTAEGSDGVADAVRDNPGMIGYVELSFARERRLNVAAVEGADGFVLPDTSAVTEAVASLRLNGDGTVTPSFATTPGYPLSVVTYLLLRQDYEDRQTAVNVRGVRPAAAVEQREGRIARLRAAFHESPHPRRASDRDRRPGRQRGGHDDDGGAGHRGAGHRAARGRDPGDDGTHDACDGFAVRRTHLARSRAHRLRSRPHSAQP